jgi:hypothetical protein
VIPLDLLTPARVGVAACVAISIVTVAVQLPRALVQLGETAGRNASFSYEDREFGAGNSIIPDKQLLYEARALIPPDGTFQVVTRSGSIRDERPLTREFAANFADYFLIPRRPSPTSPWLICLGCDSSNVAGDERVVWTDGAGSMLLERGR